MPLFIPKPHGWGKFHAPSDIYFVLSDYVPILPGPPDHDKLSARLAELHRTTTSHNGMFGFEETTCDGALPHCVEWKNNWGDFYSALLRGVLEHDAVANGRWADLDFIADRIITVVIPRLLGVLQADGRQLKPALIHGDLHEGNIGTDARTGDVIIWDASSFYAHNEMELGLWRWNKKMNGFLESYFHYFEKSEPKEEWDDRNRLYSVKSKLNMSADHPGEEGKRMRQRLVTPPHNSFIKSNKICLYFYYHSACEDLQYLYDKYNSPKI